MDDSSADATPVTTPEPTPVAAPMPDVAPQMMPGMDSSMGQMPNMGMPGMMPGMDQTMGQMPNMGMPYYGYPGMPGMMPYPGMPNMGMPAEAVNYQPAQFQSFSPNVNPVADTAPVRIVKINPTITAPISPINIVAARKSRHPKKFAAPTAKPATASITDAAFDGTFV